MAIKTYDFKNVTFTFGPYSVSEFEEGGIEFTLDGDLFVKKKGAGGEFSRSKMNGVSGSFRVRLKQTSASVSDFNALYLLDQTGNAGAQPAMLKDNNSAGLLIASENGWIKSFGPITFAPEEGAIEFIIDCDACAINMEGYTL